MIVENPMKDLPYGTHIVALIDNKKVLLSRSGHSKPYVLIDGEWISPEWISPKRHYENAITYVSVQQMTVNGTRFLINSSWIYRIFAHSFDENMQVGAILYGRHVNHRQYNEHRQRSAYLSKYYRLDTYPPEQQKLHTPTI